MSSDRQEIIMTLNTYIYAKEREIERDHKHMIRAKSGSKHMIRKNWRRMCSVSAYTR